MSGRGRGRGRGRAPPSGARQLLQRSAQEAGLDAGNLRNLQDITRPQLYPDFEWHSSGRMGHDVDTATTIGASTHSQMAPSKRAKESMVYLINKGREMQHWFQESPCYVRPSQELDVVRYNKRPRPLEADVNVASYIGNAADPRYIPSELLPDKIPQSDLKAEDGEDGVPKRAQTLEELAAEEQRKKNGPKVGEDGEEQARELSDNDVEEEDEEEVADYTQDYYASDDESDGGGNEDEAIF